MKKYNLLAWALGISMVLLAAAGVYLKYGILRPLSLYQDKSAVELPFLLMSDPQMRDAIQEARNPSDPPENPSTGNNSTDGPDSTSDPPQTTGTAEDPTVDPTHPGTEEPTLPSTIPSEATDPPVTTNPPATKPPETTAPPATTDGNPGFEFSGPAVDWSWFDDVLFIGDSRTVGLRDYARAGNADYFCNVGMSSFTALKTTASDTGFSEQTLEKLLSSKTYGKVFINLGINECGYSMSSLIKAYQKVVDAVRQTQPEAVIILHGIMNVGKTKAAGKDYFQPAHLAAINEEIQMLANGTDIFYIDVNSVFTDSSGYLLSTVSGDGCHLYAKYDKVWADWMRYAVAALGL